ncbi:MAG: DUF58 domain-containing protein [Acidobacteria bacterium]|nr:DUF58 domain-containing protein [Acidobacteriota bacterium]
MSKPSAGAALVPPDIAAPAESRKRFGGGFGPRFLFLLLLGLVWIVPAFRDRRFVYGMLAWDALLLLAWIADLASLPTPQQLLLARRWHAPLALRIEGRVLFAVENTSRSALSLKIVDDVPVSLRSTPAELAIVAPPGESTAEYFVLPSSRGDAFCGFAFLRYQSGLRIAERWARADLRQQVRVYPNLNEAEQHSMYLMRSRQTEIEKRYLRIRGEGREFESLREYQDGDDLRDICWTATARRARAITKVYRMERSQPVWIVIDCGRLMRTRVGDISKLDSAVNAALSVAQVAVFSGDRVGVMTYGREIRSVTPLGRGNAHLRQIIGQLAAGKEEAPEADHFRASNALMTRQRRRALVVWLTDFPETSMTPEVLQAATRLTRTHLLLLVAISQPDLRALAAEEPANEEAMFRIAAAQELVNRREKLLAALRDYGAVALEADWKTLSASVVNEYLNLKDQGRI